MVVPEATMYKDHCLVPGEYQIRCAWQVSPVDPKAQALPVDVGSDEELRLRVPGPDRRHVAAPRGGDLRPRQQVPQVEVPPDLGLPGLVGSLRVA